MANIINLSTAGIAVAYAVEETAGTRPTTDFTRIHGMKSTPNLNPAPETIEATTLDETEYKTYVEGLKDLGGALEFTANLTQNLITEWDALMTAYETAVASNKNVWFAIVIPGLEEAVYFTGKPSNLGAPETSVNAILETTVYITATNEPTWNTKPTLTEA